MDSAECLRVTQNEALQKQLLFRKHTRYTEPSRTVQGVLLYVYIFGRNAGVKRNSQGEKSDSSIKYFVRICARHLKIKLSPVISSAVYPVKSHTNC